MYIYHYPCQYDSGYTVVAFSTPKHDKAVEMKDWCHTVYGDAKDRWKGDPIFGELRFKDEKDLMLFILRWS